MRRPSRLILASALALAIPPATEAQTAPAAGPGVMTLSVLDVGQGDAILVRSPEDKTALIDAGPSHHVVPLLKRLGVTTLDLLVITHHHADHYNGAAAVVEAFPTRVFLASDSSHTSPHYLRLLELVRDRGIRAVGPSDSPRRIELGSVVLTVLPKAPEDPAEENNNSVGLRLQYGVFSAMLPGDAEAAERSWWLDHAPNLCANCAVLKLAHHGSRNGTDARWLGAVRPWIAVASLGKGNEFHHPHPETVALLARRGISMMRTDEAGTITFASDGRTWWVAEGRPSAPAPPEAAEAVSRKARARPGEKPATAFAPIDLNTATEEELRSLPGIGPALARRIVEGRPYRFAEDLRRVKGIGPKHLEEILPLVRADR